MAAHEKKGGSPCFTCAYFRRAATNRRAQELGFNKVALAHHNDDAVETFFMNLVTSGQLRTFLPVTPLSRSGITVLRPLLYYREQEIRELVAKLGLKLSKTPVLMTVTPCVRTSRSISQRSMRSIRKFMSIWRRPCVTATGRSCGRPSPARSCCKNSTPSGDAAGSRLSNENKGLSLHHHCCCLLGFNRAFCQDAGNAWLQLYADCSVAFAGSGNLRHAAAAALRTCRPAPSDCVTSGSSQAQHLQPGFLQLLLLQCHAADKSGGSSAFALYCPRLCHAYVASVLR